jgi:carbamate kinase
LVLGGNAFATSGQRLTMESQMLFAYEAMSRLLPLLDENFQWLISHGNGPQVGHILIRVEEALGQAYRFIR